ncbi:MAG: hypothetical protein ACOQNV_00440 [Mycoplasmoidaceae bacterium]
MKLTKLLIGSTIALPTTIVPLTTMTSCAQSWGNLSAFSIGGATTSEGPYTDIEDYYDYDAVPYSNYLQSNYSINQASNTAYAYSSPMKWQKGEQGQKGQWVLGESGWYSAGSSVFNSRATWTDPDKKVHEDINARNGNLSSNISFVNTIGLTINNYLANALHYQSSQISINEKDTKESVKVAWGEQAKDNYEFTLDFSEELQNFFESGYANANLNGSGRASAMLRTSNVSFYFDGANPLPSYTFTTEGDPDTRSGFSTQFLSYLEEEELPASYTINDFKYYSSKSNEPVSKDKEDEHYVLQYNNVPIKVKVRSFTQSYLNPQKSGSFLVNDYYSSSEQVLSTIGNQWKATMPEITGCSKDEAIPHFKTFKWNTNTQPVGFDAPGTDKDTRLTGLAGNDFIVLINYTLSVYTKDGHQYKDDKAAISGMSNIFPASWLDIFSDRKDWYKETYNGSGLYTINPSTVSHIADHFNQLLRRSNGKMAKDLSQTDKNYLTFLGYIFASDGRRLSTQDILEPSDEI